MLVTGGASGIGRAAALAFARRGASVVVVDRDEAGRATAEAIDSAGGTAVFVEADVTVDGDVRGMVTTAVEQFGRLDVAHNNAGIEGPYRRLVDVDRAGWDAVLAVNLTAVWSCMREELRVMSAQGGGAIVNTASILGLVGLGHSAAYAAAKHGVLGLTRVAAIEHGGEGIRVNAVCPGFIDTPMLVQRERGGRGLPAPIVQRLAASAPAGRLGRDDEVAEAVVWLASDESSFVNGETIAIDGGYTAQ